MKSPCQPTLITTCLPTATIAGGTAAAVCAPHLLLHDGDASRVDIEIHENDQNAVPRVEVFDNGRGMTRFELTERLEKGGSISHSITLTRPAVEIAARTAQIR
jgi:hypothetical protein